MYTIYQWAKKWGVSSEAVQDLFVMQGLHDPDLTDAEASRSEAAVQSHARYQAAIQYKALLWRNNVGETADHVRYGLCNESKKVNEKLKSSDLIGPVPKLVTPDMVGTTVGLFGAVECKAGGWSYSGTKHESAQLAFGRLVQSRGGLFTFYSGGPLMWLPRQ